jgi:hypothetical protein
MSFRTLSIKGKLMLITMLTSSVALLVASAGLLVYDLVAFRDRMSQDLMTEARIIGANSAAGLAFHDERAATEILAALKARDETVSAALYTPNGELFASYLRDGAARLPSRSRGDGYEFENHRLEVSQAVVLHGEVLGTLQIVSDMRHWGRAPPALYVHCLHPDAGLGGGRVPVLVEAADGHLQTDSRSGTNDADRFEPQELRVAGAQAA